MGFWRTWLGKLDGWETWGDSGLADEASAYLQGRLLERQRARGAGGRAPGWLWLNAVAHGDTTLLGELAAAPRPGVTVTGWRVARAALAHELLRLTAGDPEAVAAVQRQVLVPLENRLDDVRDLTPAKLHEIALHEMRLIGS